MPRGNIELIYILPLFLVLLITIFFLLWLVIKTRRQMNEYSKYVKETNDDTLPFNVKQVNVASPYYSYPAYPTYAPRENPYSNHNYRESFAHIDNEVIEPLEESQASHPEMKHIDEIRPMRQPVDFSNTLSQQPVNQYIDYNMNRPIQNQNYMSFEHNPYSLDNEYENMSFPNQTNNTMMHNQLPKTLYSSMEDHNNPNFELSYGNTQTIPYD